MQNFEHYFLIQKNIFNHRKTKDETDERLTAQFFMGHSLICFDCLTKYLLPFVYMNRTRDNVVE